MFRDIGPITDHFCSIMHSFYKGMDCTAWWSSAPGLTTQSQVPDRHMRGRVARADVFRPKELMVKCIKCLSGRCSSSHLLRL
jgi:hypothetical protein